MAEKETIDIVLDKPRCLRLEFASLSAIARQFPDTDPLVCLQQLVRVEGEGDSRRIYAGNLWGLQVLLWAALRHEDATLTVDQVGWMINDWLARQQGSLGDLALAVYAAWQVGSLGTAREPSKNVEAGAAANVQ